MIVYGNSAIAKHNPTYFHVNVNMITPRFNLSQNDKTVSINIRAPYCNLQELDVSVEEHIFIFSCQPYYLRLHLPGPIEENDNTHSCFDADNGEFTFTYEKINYGENFPDLQFVTKLLCPKIEVGTGQRKIEIVNPEVVTNDNIHNTDNGMEYGFAMRGGYEFNLVSGEFRDTFEIDPHQIKFEQRQELRKEMEKKHFNTEHYLADLLDNDEISELTHLKSPWESINKTSLDFTEKELDFLKDLVNVDYNLNQKQIEYCHNSLIEILYAYCYDCRSTCFEATCESGWTISKLSASLCCFDSFSTVKEAIVCAFRRSLIYPLYRNFNFSQKVFTDLKCVINLGEQYIIKCLIEIYNIFLTGDCGRYVLNNLFFKDYIVYIMKWDQNLWKHKIEELNLIQIDKKDLGLNLLQIEKLATNEDNLSSTMANLTITEDSETDSDDTLNESSSESESDQD